DQHGLLHTATSYQAPHFSPASPMAIRVRLAGGKTNSDPGRRTMKACFLTMGNQGDCTVTSLFFGFTSMPNLRTFSTALRCSTWASHQTSRTPLSILFNRPLGHLSM